MLAFVYVVQVPETFAFARAFSLPSERERARLYAARVRVLCLRARAFDGGGPVERSCGADAH